MGHMSLHQARHLGQHVHGDAHHRRAPAPEPEAEPEAAGFDAVEAATGIKIHAPDRAALVPRSTSTVDSNTSQKPITSSTFTLPIVLGIVIPVVAAAVWFAYLHRRHVRKQREEDANDRHASLDFGMGNVPGGMKQGANVTTIRELANAEKGLSPTSRSARQKSMDMNLESPYLLPPDLGNSRESLHSLSKTVHQEADPYRPVTQYTQSDAASIRSYGQKDNGSTYTHSSAAPSRTHESSELLSNAASPARTDPPVPNFPARQNSLPQGSPSSSPIDEPHNSSPLNPNAQGVQTKGLPNSLRPGSMITPTSPLAAIENLATPQPIVPIIRMPEHPDDSEPALPSPGPSLQQTPNRKPAPSLPGIVDMPAEPEEHLPVVQPRASVMSEVSDYGDAFQITPPSPTREEKRRTQRYSMDVPPEEFANAGLGAPGFDPKRLSMGFRPLPPDAGNESESPEVRANRIRSFYKEYFDDSKPAPQGQYYEDEENYLGDAAYFDPDSNNFVMPYAEPVTRRAMTPPPRGPRFMGGPPPRANTSMGGPMRGPGSPGPRDPGPRAQSSASNRGPPRGPAKKPLPPPSPLSTLPTPSQLKDDSFAIMNSLDFAPPTTYRDRQAGIRPESPMGESRPYSPHVPSATPLVSTFDELSVMPSPHMLRNSGTFTSLDFAAPRKFRDPESGGGSDAGSIRSNRSGVSQMQQAAIRNGAYRVSRLPQDMVFSKDDIAASLKPTWGMRQGTSPHPSQTAGHPGNGSNNGTSTP